MSAQTVLILTLTLPLFTGVACLFFADRLSWQRGLSILSTLVMTITSALLLVHNQSGEIVVLAVGQWVAPVGIVLVSDLLTSLMLVACNGVAFLAAVYAVRQVPEKEQRTFFFPLFHLLLLGVNGSVMTGDLFNLYVWFEVMLLSSFVLLTLGKKKAQLEGALKYVTLNIVASLMFLSAVGILYGKLGTLNMADLAQKVSEHPEDILVLSSAGVVLLAAFAIKSALFPFFFWLPASYHTPTVAIGALFAGLLTKVGVYVFLRIFTLVFDAGEGFFHIVLVIIAGFTMVVGVLGAAAHFEIKRILSFHIVSQIGYMIMGLTFMTPAALGATIFFVIHNMVAKTNLFFIAGIVEKISGTTDLKNTGGLIGRAPFLSALFLISALALAGLPPLSGFFGKLALVKAGFDVGAYWIVAVSLMVGVMTLFSMTKIWGEAFWKDAPESFTERPADGVRVPVSMWFPVIVLAFMAVAMGLACEPVLRVMEQAGAQLLDRQPYIDAVLGGNR